MKHYPDPTRRRGRPLRHPSHDERTPEEIAWWNTNVSDPKRAHPKPLPLDAPLPDNLPNPWVLNNHVLLKKLTECCELVRNIPISTLGRHADRHSNRPQRYLQSPILCHVSTTPNLRSPNRIRQESEACKETCETAAGRSENR
jgi:hypothetical protein